MAKISKYEIMIVVSGEIDEANANKVCDELSTAIQSKNINTKKLGLKDLAYEIKKVKQGWYFQLNFECDNPNSLKEFARLSRINKNVLRHLIINLEKDYGYNAINNAKKVARNQKRAQIYQHVQEEIKKRAEEKLLAQQNSNE